MVSRRKFAVWTCLCACLLVALADIGSAHQPVDEPLRVGIYENEPKIFRDDQGQPAGLFVDILQAVADEEGWTLEYVDCAWEQCLNKLEAGELDLMPDVAFTRPRSERFDYHQVSVVDTFSQIYADRRGRYDSFADLRGKRIAVLAESSQQEELRRRNELVDGQFELVPAPTFHAAFQSVVDGNADVVISNVFFAERHASTYGLSPTPLVVQPADLYFAAPSGLHEHELAAIDKHLRAWKEQAPSPYYAALNRWRSAQTDRATPEWVWYLVLGTLVALALAALIIAILRKQVAVRTRHLHERNEELRKNQRHLSLIVDHGPDLVLHVDLDGRVVFVNSAIREITGHAPESVRGSEFASLFAPPLDDDTLAALEGPFDENEVFELALQHADGAPVPVEVRIGRIFDQDGDPWLFQCTIRDLSERVEAIRARRRSEARAQLVIKSLPLAALVWRATEHGIVLESLNDAAVDLFSDRGEAWAGSSLADLYDDEHPISQLVKRCLAQEAGERLQTELALERDGEELTVVLISGFLEPDSVLLHIEDVTERVLMRRQLQVSQRLETAGLLAGGVAHDFNNLLTVINSNARLALEEIDGTSTAHEDVEQILDAGEKAANITRQLLTFTRQTDTEPQLISLSETVGQLADMLQHFIPESINLQIDLDGDDDWILIDPTQVEQVVMNLVLNARDAIEQQGEIRVATRVVADQEKAVLEVSDDGAGMDEDTLEHVFDPFFSTKQIDRGTGLGLSMVYGAITRANGSIDIDSQQDRGTTVVVELPLAEEADVVELSEGDSAQLARPGERILVVEDEDSVRRVVERIVKRAGYEVLTAASVEEALEHLSRQETVSLVLTDVVMPHRSGASLVERIRAEFPTVQTLFMSGYTDNELGQHGVASEQAALIKKPFAPQELAARLRQVLDGGRA